MGEDPPRANVLLGRVQLFHQIKTVREILWIDRLRRIRILVHGTSSRLAQNSADARFREIQRRSPSSPVRSGGRPGEEGRVDEGQRTEDAEAADIALIILSEPPV